MELSTRIRSTAMRALSSAAFLDILRTAARLKRKFAGEPQAVHYFHQVDDPYSHLAVQKLDQLKAAYDLPFIAHLVPKPAAVYQGSSEHFDNWALVDALSVTADYGTELEVTRIPGPAEIQSAVTRLAPFLAHPDFATRAMEIGTALWTGTLEAHTSATDAGDIAAGEKALAEGNAMRARLGHYLGGMFYFDGEWFWGIDRIRLLEQRLIDEGFGDSSPRLCVPEPVPADTSGPAASNVVLEYFPSLRSPYTAIGHQRVLDLVASSGVTLQLRPVMPMMMRGVAAPRAKQRYIITDAGREARARGIPFGHIVDPFGDPVKRAFALFPAALALGKDMAFVTAYLSAAWAEGIDITTETGLRRVAANGGIDWQELQTARQGTDWEAMLDSNLRAMLSAGLWGVPSFRVSGGNEDAAYACWGQDRIWRVASEIARRARG